LNFGLLSQLLQKYHTRGIMQMVATPTRKYLSQFPLESTNAAKTKATKKEAILYNDEINSTTVKGAWRVAKYLRPEKKGMGETVQYRQRFQGTIHVEVVTQVYVLGKPLVPPRDPPNTFGNIRFGPQNLVAVPHDVEAIVALLSCSPC
jgi:hypothetical protein